MIFNMKKFLIVIAVVLSTIIGCTTNYNAHKYIRKEFPDAEIYHIRNFRFVVVDSSGLYYIECNHLKDERITYMQTIKLWQNQ